MATMQVSTRNEPISSASAERVDMKFEVVVIPVADVDRSKEGTLTIPLKSWQGSGDGARNH